MIKRQASPCLLHHLSVRASEKGIWCYEPGGERSAGQNLWQIPEKTTLLDCVLSITALLFPCGPEMGLTDNHGNSIFLHSFNKKNGC